MTSTLASPRSATDTLQDGRRDFDFLFGTWTVRNERLAKRLQGCTEWLRFPADQEAWPILGGLGNMDCIRTVLPDGRALEGRTIRVFDPTTRLWSIHWIDSLNCRMFPAVVGAFDGPFGEFFGDDACEGRPVRVRFRWTALSPTEATWEQAFSVDGGEAWETNWIMRFTRVGASA
jgi:hypothetical protein